MIDKRGAHMVEKGAKTRDKIKEYLKAHPEASKTEVKNSIGITYATLRNHLAAIEEVEGWRLS